MKHYPIISTDPPTDAERASWAATERRTRERQEAEYRRTHCRACDAPLRDEDDTYCQDCYQAAQEEDADPSLRYWATYPLDEYADSVPDRDYCPCCLHDPCICQWVIDKAAGAFD